MLVSKTAIIKWNSKIQRHYINLGYHFTKMGDEFEVNVNDLTNGSSAIITYTCDYCGIKCHKKWYCYINQRKICPIDACTNPSCYEQKSSESLMIKYGVPHALLNEKIKEKQHNTNLERYGCINPFSNEKVKQKIKNYYLTNFGVSASTQVPSIIEKQKATLLKRYGVDNYSKTKEFRKKFRGEGSPVWKGDKVKHERTERGTPEYREWRKKVFGRDLYTCQHCGARNGNGKYIRLEAHHLYDFKNYPLLRYEVSNGVTLCAKCHTCFHSKYGKHGNTKEQFEEYNSIDKKIC